MTEKVKHPKHYQGVKGLEAREVHENFVPAYEKYGGIVASDVKDALKYILRAPHKNELEDIDKAINMLEYAKEGMINSMTDKQSDKQDIQTKTRIYLAHDIFTKGNAAVARSIQEMINDSIKDSVYIYNPLDNDDINDKSGGFSSGYDILLADFNKLYHSDMIVALMDGEDTGVVAEVAYAWSLGIPVFQLYTDIRLGGNDVESKFDAMKQDIFQNDFKYFNKLVSGISYGDNRGRLYDENHPTIKNPLIYTSVADLIEDVAIYAQHGQLK